MTASMSRGSVEGRNRPPADSLSYDAKWSLVLLATMCAVSLMISCRHRLPSAAAWATQACLVQEDCDGPAACVLGQCHDPGALDEPMDVEAIYAAQWFSSETGSCDYDDECGPWVCAEGTCVSPLSAGRALQSRRDYTYWDTSCRIDVDCGAWICASGWCADRRFASPEAVAGGGSTTSDESSCLGDDECAAGADCVFPGRCHRGAGAETMTFSELDGTAWTGSGVDECIEDAECGPLACDGGRCVAQEIIGSARPPRSSFRYFDASCSADEHCGEWVCVGGWCNDPARR